MSFSVTGDVPAGLSEISIFQTQINNHNKYSSSAFFVHVGDIISGSESCIESKYLNVANIMQGLVVPAYIVPGDNETVDCSSPSSGYNYFLKYFQNFEQNYPNPFSASGAFDNGSSERPSTLPNLTKFAFLLVYLLEVISNTSTASPGFTGTFISNPGKQFYGKNTVPLLAGGGSF